jgi:hypothetical protein
VALPVISRASLEETVSAVLARKGFHRRATLQAMSISTADRSRNDWRRLTLVFDLEVNAPKI